MERRQRWCIAQPHTPGCFPLSRRCTAGRRAQPAHEGWQGGLGHPGSAAWRAEMAKNRWQGQPLGVAGAGGGLWCPHGGCRWAGSGDRRARIRAVMERAASSSGDVQKALGFLHPWVAPGFGTRGELPRVFPAAVLTDAAPKEPSSGGVSAGWGQRGVTAFGIASLATFCTSLSGALPFPCGHR